MGIVNKINEFVEKCEKTMEDLQDKCDDAFKCGGKDKRATDLLGLTHDTSDADYREMLEAMDEDQGFAEYLKLVKRDSQSAANVTDSEDATISVVEELNSLEAKFQVNATNIPSQNISPDEYPSTNVYYDKEAYHRHHPNDTLQNGKVYHVRTRRGFWDNIICIFKTIGGLIARPVCKVIFSAITHLCRVPKLLTHFIGSIMLKRFENLEATVKNNIWMDVNANLTFSRDVVEVRSRYPRSFAKLSSFLSVGNVLLRKVIIMCT